MQAYGETDDVESDGDRLGEEEDDPDGAAKLDAQAAADEVVGTAAADAGVGGNGGQGETSQERDDVGQ